MGATGSQQSVRPVHGPVAAAVVLLGVAVAEVPLGAMVLVLVVLVVVGVGSVVVVEGSAVVEVAPESEWAVVVVVVESESAVVVVVVECESAVVVVVVECESAVVVVVVEFGSVWAWASPGTSIATKRERRTPRTAPGAVRSEAAVAEEIAAPWQPREEAPRARVDRRL